MAEKIASSLSKEVYEAEGVLREDIDYYLNILNKILNIIKEQGTSSELLERIANRQVDHKYVKNVIDKVCSKGIESRAIISCRKDYLLKDKGLLANVPILIKDNMEAYDLPLTLGTEYYRYLPPRDSPAVSRLRSSGAIIFGTTNMHELALGTTGVNPHYGTPLNPCCPDRIPGGSSSGSASIVAQNIAPIAFGNDAGGSVRLPAAYTGVVGFKFSREFITPEGSRPFLSKLSSIGVFSKKVGDLIAIMEALNNGSSERVLHFLEIYRNDKIKVLIPVNLLERVQEPVRSVFEEVKEIIKNKPNIIIEEAEMPLPLYIERSRVVVTLSDALYDYFEIHRRYRNLVSDDIDFLLDIAENIPSWAYFHAKKLLDEYRNLMINKLSKYDVILMPTITMEPPKIDEADWRLSASNKLIELTTPWNILEAPAVSLPAPRKLPCGVPLGVQLASMKSDEELIAVSIIFESIFAREME